MLATPPAHFFAPPDVGGDLPRPQALEAALRKAGIAKKMKAIKNGSFYEFAGPLYDQHGKLRVKKGQRMQVLKGGTNSLYGMNWLVRGVIGSPKGH